MRCQWERVISSRVGNGMGKKKRRLDMNENVELTFRQNVDVNELLAPTTYRSSGDGLLP